MRVDKSMKSWTPLRQLVVEASFIGPTNYRVQQFIIHRDHAALGITFVPVEFHGH